ncbi:MAG: ribosome maturation factor RimM [Rhizobiaceae bacterium]
MKLENPILMASIGGPHGTKGEVRVKAFGDDPMTLDQYGSLYAKDGRKFKITRMRPSKTVLIVKFKGVNYRDEAEALNGIDLYIDRSMLPDDMEEDEFYVTDLVDCQVQDTDGNPLGKVLAVVNFGAGDLIEIQQPGSDKTLMLEFSRENVPAIELEAKLITVDPPVEVSERDT